MPICPDCSSSELIQQEDPAFFKCTACQQIFTAIPNDRFCFCLKAKETGVKASTLDHDATQSDSLLSKGPDHSNIVIVATTNEKQAKHALAQKRGRSNIQT